MPGKRTKSELLEELMTLKSILNEELAKSQATITRIEAKLQLLRNEMKAMGLHTKVPVVTLQTLDPYAGLTHAEEEHILESALEQWRETRTPVPDDDQES